jgi:transcriptional antiterminator Rof (Rho-off)
MRDKYIPVACSEHEAFQFAVLKRIVLDLSWYDESGKLQRLRGVPTDVTAHDSAEYLVFEGNDGVVYSVRLDRITAAHNAESGESLMRG